MEAAARTYPAVFREEYGGVWYVIFPDLGCVTCGDTKDEAEIRAQEALSYWLNYEDFPSPSPMADIVAKTELGDEVILIEARPSEYPAS